MKNLKKRWFAAMLLVVVLLGSGIGQVSADLEAFLVRSVGGDYYQYSEDELNYSYLSNQLDATSATGTMYRQFAGLLSAGGKVVGLKDSVKGYMDYQATGAAYLKAQLAKLAFDVNQYLALDSAKVLVDTIGRLYTVDAAGKATEVIAEIPLASYNEAGTFGPATGTETISSDVIINVPSVTLQNFHITGNLIIGEGVGSGDVTLNNVTVDGDTFVRGGGKNSIHIYGGSYNKITVEKTATGEVRIVATNAAGLEIVVSNDATGEDVILEGDFANVTVNAPDVNIKTQGETTIEKMNVAEAATGCQVNLAEGTQLKNVVLDSAVDMKGKGTVDNAEINSDGVKFETKPTTQQVAETVTVPPVVTPPTPPPSNPDPPYIAVTELGLSSADAYNEMLLGGTLQLKAAIFPNNATNRQIEWTVIDQPQQYGYGQATISSSGLLTGTAPGWVYIEAKNPASGLKNSIWVDVLSVENWKLRQYRNTIAFYSNIYEGDTKLIANFAGISEAVQTDLTGYQADLRLTFTRPLEEGEQLKLTACGNEYTLTSAQLSEQNLVLKLSKLENFSYNYNPLATDQSGSWQVSVVGTGLKAEIDMFAQLIVSKDGVDSDLKWKNNNLRVFRDAYKSYFDSVKISGGIDPAVTTLTVTYAGIADEDTKIALNGCYADAAIHLHRPLEDGEAVKLTAFGNSYTITKTELPGKDIRLSELIKLEAYTDANLVANQTGSFSVVMEDISLKSKLNFDAETILIKEGNAINSGNGYYGTPIYSKGMLAYADKTAITVDQGKAEFNLTHGSLTTDEKAGLSGYYADTEIYLERPLVADESITVTGFGRTATVTAAQLNQNQSIILSELLKTAPVLATERQGLFPIKVQNNTLKTNLNLDFRPLLVKSINDIVQLQWIDFSKVANLQLNAGTNQEPPTAEQLIPVCPTTVGGSDGMITGLTDEMEYHDQNNGTWEKVTGTEIAGLKAGSYYIRNAGTETANASEYCVVWLPERASVPQTQSYDQGSYTNLEIPVTFNDNGLKDIKLDAVSLADTVDYTVDYERSVVILTSDYLKTQAIGALTLTLEFYGMSTPCTVTISNTGFKLDVTKLVTAPDDPNIANSQANQDAIEVIRTGKTVNVYGNLDDLTAYISTDLSQPDAKKWIGLIVDTGEESIDGVKCNGTDASSVGAPDGSFVLWIDASEVALTPKEFTLTKGDKSTTITINFKESKVSFLTSVVLDEKVVLVKLYKPDPDSYAVSYGGTVLEYDPEFKAFKAYIPKATAADLVPTITPK